METQVKITKPALIVSTPTPGYGNTGKLAPIVSTPTPGYGNTGKNNKKA